MLSLIHIQMCIRDRRKTYEQMLASLQENIEKQRAAVTKMTDVAVSYTHLDVYKRQVLSKRSCLEYVDQTGENNLQLRRRNRIFGLLDY